MIRVCNLCMEKIEEADVDDDDDRRSIVSSFSFSGPSPFTAHQLGPQMQSTSDLHSPYTASALFGGSDEPYGLFTRAETRRSAAASEVGDDPTGIDWEDSESTAPFRRNISDEDKVDVMTTNSKSVDISPDGPGPNVSLSLNGELLEHGSSPTRPDMGDRQQSTIQFPGSGPAENDSPRPSLRTVRVSSAVESSDLRAEMLRSRAQSRVGYSLVGEPGWRTRRESTA